MPRKKIENEDTGEVLLEEVPLVVIKTELESFNGFDRREFPVGLLGLEDRERVVYAYYAETVRANKYVRGLLTDLNMQDFAVVTVDWDNIEAMVARVEYLRGAFNVSRKILEDKFARVPKYGTDRFAEYMRNEVRCWKYLEESRVLSELVNQSYAYLMVHLANEMAEQGRSKEFDALRMAEYEKVRKSLYRERRKVYNENQKEVV